MVIVSYEGVDMSDNSECEWMMSDWVRVKIVKVAG